MNPWYDPKWLLGSALGLAACYVAIGVSNALAVENYAVDTVGRFWATAIPLVLALLLAFGLWLQARSGMLGP